MLQNCGRNCSCSQELDIAALALVEASQMLSDSLAISSDQMFETCWARVRAAKARLQAARAIYLEHRLEELVAR